MSAETRTSLANRALDILGRGPSGNIDTDKNELARRLAARLAGAILLMLRMNKWAGARKVLSLAGSSLSDDDYLFEIQLPADCAAVWKVGDADDGWERRSGQGAGSVVTNRTPPVKIEYARILAPAEMTEEMLKVAAIILADETKHHAALSAGRRAEIAQERRETIKEAARVAGSEDGPDTPFTSPWLDAMWGA